MVFALVYLLARRLVRLVAGPVGDLSSEVEVVVLRHQLMVLKRQVGRPRLRRRDRSSVAPGAGATEVDLPSDVNRRQATDQ